MSSSDPIVAELITQTLSAISQGKSHLVVWGTNPTGLRVLSTLNAMGFLPLVSALVDHRQETHGRTVMGLTVIAPECLKGIDVDTVIVAFDKDKELVLETLVKHDRRLLKLIFAGSANYDFADPIFEQIVKSCLVKSKAGGYPNMLVHLFQCLKYISEKPVQGDVAEFGVYQGGTTVFMAKVLKYFGNDCRIYGFDTFQGFPPATHVLDTYVDQKCEFSHHQTVRDYCAPYNIELVIGDIRETATALCNVNLALSFFDTDNYSATKKALEICVARTLPGGILAFDHYFSPGWSQTVGERIAARQVLREMNLLNLHGTGIFFKV